MITKEIKKMNVNMLSRGPAFGKLQYYCPQEPSEEYLKKMKALKQEPEYIEIMGTNNRSTQVERFGCKNNIAEIDLEQARPKNLKNEDNEIALHLLMNKYKITNKIVK